MLKLMGTCHFWQVTFRFSWADIMGFSYIFSYHPLSWKKNDGEIRHSFVGDVLGNNGMNGELHGI